MKKMVSITHLHDGLGRDNGLPVDVDFRDGIPGSLDDLLDLRGLLVQAATCGRRQVSQGILATAAEDLDALCCIPDVQSVLTEKRIC